MFTVCPKCALTLVVTAADLRVAQGYVRCGRCLNVFNALARLSEERPAAAAEPPPDMTPDAAPEPQEAATAPEPPPPPQQPAFTQPPTQSSTLDDTGEIEIELDPSIFVTAVRPPIPQESVPEPEPEPLPPPPAASMEAAASPPVAAATPITGPEAPPPDPAVVLEPEQTESSSSPPDAPQTNTVPPLPESAFEVAGLRPRAGLAWKVGAGALAITLALQIVNHYRDALAANPALKGPLSTVYSALGVKLAPHWNIHEYDVRQLGASVSGAAAGEIVVRASVKNSASRPQPLPLLRVTLQDRFGNRIAARDVPPGDYLPASVAPSSLLAAGSRVDATMVFVDPGPQAVGFEIDACLRQRSGAVACAHEGP
jgi:predicted Zn finger-like uncharacterized protein